jgi:diguanylate cyclase (GGDEF)-like protein
MGWLGLWWGQPDHYDELSAHLQARGLAPLARASISVTAFGMAVVALATLWESTGPRGALPIACVIAAIAATVAGAMLWVLRLPSRAESIRFVILASSSIALVALAQHEPFAAMLSCATFATLACFIALTHAVPLIAYNFAIAAVVGGVETVRIAGKYGIVAALGSYLMLLVLNLVVPIGIQVVVHMLGSDAVLAERDQLTGLLTRRAFQRGATAQLERGREQLAHVVIAVIDLDSFKQLNDNYGHSTGDDALVSVARALRDTNDDSAVICRSGGEEFVLADIWHPEDVAPRAQQICEVIAALPFGITASIGTAGIHPAHRTGDSGDLLFELIAAADAAMYTAKRRGGNQTGHHEWPLPSPLDSYTPDETDYRDDGISA